MDNSAVFHRDMLDAEHAALFNLPWIFDTDENGPISFTTEYGACMAQREYRKRRGFDPETGELL